MNIPKPYLLALFLFLGFVFFSCKQTKPEADVQETETPVATVSYPSLGNQELTKLYADADKVDMIFYDLPISVNQDDAASAKNSVMYILPAPAEINPACKALGRLSWISDGSIIKEADIYVDSLCHYFIFMSNNQPVAANAMSESGVGFFTNVISQVQQRQK